MELLALFEYIYERKQKKMSSPSHYNLTMTSIDYW